MASVVAWVGRAKSTPARPVRAASTSAAMRAASVLPPPVDSSTMSIPGSSMVRAASRVRACTSVARAPPGSSKRWVSSTSGSAPSSRGCHGAGISRRDRPVATRSAWASGERWSSPSSSRGRRGKYASVEASQSATMTRPESSTRKGWDQRCRPQPGSRGPAPVRAVTSSRSSRWVVAHASSPRRCSCPLRSLVRAALVGGMPWWAPTTEARAWAAPGAQPCSPVSQDLRIRWPARAWGSLRRSLISTCSCLRPTSAMRSSRLVTWQEKAGVHLPTSWTPAVQEARRQNSSTGASPEAESANSRSMRSWTVGASQCSARCPARAAESSRCSQSGSQRLLSGS